MARAALFDVDGTLADTNHLHVVAWWEAFRQAGETVATHDIHRSIGLGSGDLIARLLGDGRDRDRDEELSSAHTTLYGTYFDRLAPLEGARDLLYALADRDWRIVLATSAGGGELAALRRAIDADDVIAGVASADDVSAGKPAPDPVHHALEIAGCGPDDAVFVGDTVWDMRAARRAGVRAVGLLCGGIPRHDLEEAGAAAVYGTPADLLKDIDSGVLTGER
ncbi:haloacid dehalogenase [Streptomyces longispororuber]|uniref:Haloacid dehalogenase n=1 Tax=Streptomyces longispororuber TaxID=68230 RepID=A0A919DNF6_9ACTN|nr:HAD family hydrolase [Streptomyces longispororuber]GHE62392.1 haloacid dehalogenase [Streptomyces longispororuber]